MRARPYRAVTFTNLWHFLNIKLILIFSHSLAIYLDNKAHFIKGVFSQKIAERGIRYIKIFISHSSFINLAEAYIKLFLN
jgi:hypothetical protein